MITTNVPTLKINKLSQAQYDRELANGNIDETALYLTPDDSLDYYVFTCTDNGDGSFTMSDNFDYNTLVNAINNGHYVNCVYLKNGRCAFLTPSFTLMHPSSMIEFSGFGQGYQLYKLRINSLDAGGSVRLNIYEYATYEDVETVIADIPKETWTFTLEDGSTVTKAVHVG